jgi:two-component system response regulator FixJ
MVEDSDKSVFVVGGESRSWAVLRALLRRCSVSVDCFARREDCLAGLATRPCDLLIIDCNGDAEDELAALAQAQGMLPPASSLVLVNPRDVATAVRAMKLGAADCLEKPVQEEQLRTAIEAGLAGVRSCAALPVQALTPAEGRVLQLILAGKTNAVIGRILHRSRRTVEAHRRNIMHKLGVFTLAGLVMRAMAMGLIIPEQESEGGPQRPAE